MVNKIETKLTNMLRIKYPIIMAPMFLVSNLKMTLEAMKSGITGAIPALNYRTINEFRKALEVLKNEGEGPFGINLIVNKSNVKMKAQLKACVDYQVDYIITSLGNPKPVIDACNPKGIKVFCDVVDQRYATKVENLGADGLIAVNSRAGGHSGPMQVNELISSLKNFCNIPVISAGGIGTGGGVFDVLKMGACGLSIGTIFIACEEAEISKEYKQAIVDHGEKDIVHTTKLSGTPCTVINTPYVQQIGTEQNWLEQLLNKNKTLKKYAKMITAFKGMKMIEKAAFNTTYKSVWCAGPSVEFVDEILPVRKIVEKIIKEYTNAEIQNNQEMESFEV